MFQRLIGLVITAAGVLLALVAGFGALLLLGLAAVAAFCVYAVRTHRWRRGAETPSRVIEGEFEVVENDGKPCSSADAPPPRVRHDEHDHG